MARHQDECPICTQIQQCREGTHPGFVAEMETGYVVLGAMQKWRGYCLLLCAHPATELDELPPGVRAQHLLDMASLAAAVRRAVSPHKLNYELLGNQAHHIHWHIFPRFSDEAEPLAPVWGQWPEDGSHALSDEERAALIDSIREELARGEG